MERNALTSFFRLVNYPVAFTNSNLVLETAVCDAIENALEDSLSGISLLIADRHLEHLPGWGTSRGHDEDRRLHSRLGKGDGGTGVHLETDKHARRSKNERKRDERGLRFALTAAVGGIGGMADDESSTFALIYRRRDVVSS